MEQNLIILTNWDKAKQAITECKTIDELKIIRDKAEALRAYTKQAQESLEVQNNVAEIKIRCERKIGEFSKELPVQSAFNADKTTHHDRKSFKTSILKDAGVQHYERYEAIANLPEKEFENHIKQVVDSNKELTTVGIIKLARKLSFPTELKPPILPTGEYNLIVIDPPWAYGTEYSSSSRRVASPYPELSQEELLKLKIPASKNSVLWLWTTHKFIWEAKELLETWGFEYKAILTWNKEKLGMGSWLRMQTEFCLLGIKGKPQWNLTNERDIITEVRREHSRKPDNFYSMIEKLCPSKNKLDIFGREGRDGWTIFGNEINKFN